MTSIAEASDTKSRDNMLAEENFRLYELGRQRGHADYIKSAKRYEDYYLGGGRQWKEADRAKLEAEGRLCVEVNGIKPAVNAALGHQIHNRMDIAFKPRGGDADDQIAEVLSKVAMQIGDDNQLRWRETQVMADGLIQQRGYFDIRMRFDENLRGTIGIGDLDPLDVIPDPDAREYDPNEWRRVLVARWLVKDEIGALFGEEAASKLDFAPADDAAAIMLELEKRNAFGADRNGTTYESLGITGEQRYLVIERQEFRMAPTVVMVSPNGDITPLPDGPIANKAQRQAEGYTFIRRMQKRVRWIISCRSTVLHDDWSPYPFFTVVPYFPYFRRGVTGGMVDNATSPQDLLNKSLSENLQIVSDTANSGWLLEENSLANMTEEEFIAGGAKNGRGVIYRRTANKPEKIAPNHVPAGIDRLIQYGETGIKHTTGVGDPLQGQSGREKSGIAIQSEQFMGLTQLSVPLDNLSRTRHMLAKRMLWFIQNYYTEERLMMITGRDDNGFDKREPLVINQYDAALDRIVNDVTLGEYDVVISEQPTQVTFAQTQFQQALEMRTAGINIPDHVLVSHSNLSKKQEILDAMKQTPPPDPLAEATVALKLAQKAVAEAQAGKVQAETTNTKVEAQYSAIQTAQTIATVPGVAPLADTMLKSAGYQDADLPPIIPGPAGMPVDSAPVAPEGHTNPLTPANPGVGLMDGIETQANDGAVQ